MDNDAPFSLTPEGDEQYFSSSSSSRNDHDGEHREDSATDTLESQTESFSESSESDDESSISPAIDLGALDSLVDALKMLRRNGGYVDYGLPWSPESKRLDGLEASKEDVALVKSTLNLVTRVVPPLRRILRSAERALPTLRETLTHLSVQQSFHLLPDEVLSIIFEFAAQDSPSMPTHLTQVSRRFRQIALRLPSLWTVLSSHKLLDDSQARLFRSGHRPLSVNICAHEGQPVPQERAFSLFNFSMTLSTRLRYLELNVRLMTDGVFFIRFLAQYPLLHLPALESLSFSLSAIADEACMSMLANAKPFLHWILPSLREIQMRNFIPAFAPIVHHQITSCTMGFGDAPIRNVNWVLESALRFVGSLVNLTELSVHMIQACFLPLSPNFVLVLPKLTKLNIESDVHDISYLASLSSAIIAPICKSFTLHLVLTHDDLHQPWIMAAVCNCRQRMPLVETFKLVVKKRRIFRKVLVNVVVNEFPRLQNLAFEGMDFEYLSTNGFFPPLRNIVLKDVKNVEHTFFFDLVENSRGPYPALSHLESVVFDGCKDVELEEIEELITKERVIWTE